MNTQNNSTQQRVDQQKRALLKIRELKAEVASLKNKEYEPIAVVGMACRFPGGVNTPDDYWKFLKNSQDGIVPIPKERWDVEEYYHDDPDKPGKMYVREGGFLSDIDQFDPEFFGLPKREANNMDPQQRLLLEVTWEALEDANIAPRTMSGERVGVYMGVCTQDYARYSLNSKNPENIEVYSFTGNAPSIASGRLSNILNLQGPNITVDTACSSSLVAVHTAVQSLRSGETDLALAGGVSVILSPENFVYFCKVNALSLDARCKAFSNDANGYVRAEGCGVVTLKLLSKALEEGDEIHGVIRGSALNQDGQSYGLTAPNGKAQKKLLQLALENAQLSANEVSFIEAHGTGTPLGDPIEMGAIAEVYGKNRDFDCSLFIGAVKSNIGHTEAAAGMAGLIKTLSCLKHGEIPANLHFSEPNKKIQWQQLPIRIPAELEPWPTYCDKKIAGVSAFGFSGTNAHLIVEEAPASLIHNSANKMVKTIFNRQRYWVKPPKLAVQAMVQTETVNDFELSRIHPLLGRKIYSSQSRLYAYESLIDINQLSYLRSHPVWGKIVFPGSAYVEMAMTAGREIFGGADVVIDHLIYQEAFVIRDDVKERLQMFLQPATDNGAISFQISSMGNINPYGEIDWHQHASGSFRKIHELHDNKQQLSFDKKSAMARCQQEIDGAVFYQRLHSSGYIYGDDHKGVEKAWLGEGEIITQVTYPKSLCYSTKSAGYCLHPALLDSAYQPLLMLLPAVAEGQMYVTLGKESVRVYADIPTRLWVHTRRRVEALDDNSTIKADIYIYDKNNKLIAETLGYVMARTSNRELSYKSKHENSIYYQTQWQKLSAVDEATSQLQGTQLIFADGLGDAVGLYVELQAQGVDCVLLHRGEVINKLVPNNYQLMDCDLENIDQVFKRLVEQGLVLGEVSGISYCWGLDDQMPASIKMDINPSGLVPFVRLIRTLFQYRDNNTDHPLALLADTFFTVITCNAQSVLVDENNIQPLQASYRSLIDVIYEEYPLCKLRYIDIDFNTSNSHDFLAVLGLLQSHNTEYSMAVRDNEIWVPRLAKLPAITTNNIAQSQGLKLAMEQRGDLSTLCWKLESRQSLGEYDVEIKVKASGLNLRDIIDGLGLHPRRLDEFGLECSGVVTAIGNSVHSVNVGDEVVAFGTGCFSQYFVVNEQRVAPKPKHIDFMEAASIPIAFLTAYYALMECGKLFFGEKVLIHTAAGGVGIAAVQLALQAGAQVYATASPEKWDFVRSLGVQYVTHSRDVKFAEDINRWTNGEGVDLVLNSLADEFIDKSVSLLKVDGRFIEIGLKGWTIEKMQQRRADLDYHIVNLMAKWESEPIAVKHMLTQLLNLFQQEKTLSPLPCEYFNSQHIVDAFRYMQQGKHIGKVIIRGVDTSLTVNDAYIGTQVITGGLGAIGLRIAKFLVANGCRSIALISRRDIDQDIEEMLAELRQQDSTINVYQGDVASAELGDLLNSIRQQMGQIKGIYHTAGLTDDGLLQDLDQHHFDRVLKPKIEGTYRLHQLTLKDDLNHFVLFSSMTSLFGSAGVANYAAANAFLNSFAQYRNSFGLPAIAIAWGPWSDAGMFAELDEQYRERLQRSGLTPLSTAESLQDFNQLIEQQGSIGIFDIDWPTWVEKNIKYKNNPLLKKLVDDREHQSIVHSKDNRKTNAIQERPKTTTILDKLQGLSEKQQRQTLVQFVKEQLADVLALDTAEKVNTDIGFFDLGIDSLTSVELRNRLQSRLSCTLPVTVIYDYATVTALTEFILQQHKPVTHDTDEKSKIADATRSFGDNNALNNVSEMSDEELVAELMR